MPFRKKAPNSERPPGRRRRCGWLDTVISTMLCVSTGSPAWPSPNWMFWADWRHCRSVRPTMQRRHHYEELSHKPECAGQCEPVLRNRAGLAGGYQRHSRLRRSSGEYPKLPQTRVENWWAYPSISCPWVRAVKKPSFSKIPFGDEHFNRVSRLEIC
jgi:hypothetical protein